MQPMFSAFGEEALEARVKPAGSKAILTQRKLVFRVRKIREACPELEHVIVAEPGDLELQPGEVHFDLERGPALRAVSTPTRRRPTPRRCCTTPPARPACPRARCMCTARSWRRR